MKRILTFVTVSVVAHASVLQAQAVDVQAGITAAPSGYASGVSVALSASPRADRRYQLRVDHNRVHADEDSGYGSVVPDGRRRTTSVLLLW